MAQSEGFRLILGREELCQLDGFVFSRYYLNFI